MCKGSHLRWTRVAWVSFDTQWVSFDTLRVSDALAWHGQEQRVRYERNKSLLTLNGSLLTQEQRVRYERNKLESAHKER